ncbi:MAG: hypothetical protein PUE85_06250 [Firmicutes bacterium]|nr:hypothetical protein [Bacillota bacterium]
MKKILFYFVYPACLYFTIIMIVFGLFATLGGFPQYAPTLTAMLWFLLFSMAVAAADKIFFLKKINIFFRVLMHYAAVIISFLLVFVVAVSNYSNAGGAFLLIIVLSILYFFFAALYFIFRGVSTAKKRDETKYKNQFRG